MKSIKLLLLATALIITTNINAQLKVFTGGNVSVGSTTTAQQTLDIFGNSIIKGDHNKIFFKNTYKYIGIPDNKDDLSIISKSGWIRIGSNHGIAFWGKSGAEDNNPHNMFLNQYGLGINGWQCWSSVSLVVNGNAHITGNLYWGSDEQFKTNINQVNNALNTILSLNGKSYNFVNNLDNYTFTKKLSYGFIAQEVQEILPNIVITDTNGYLGINYIAIIPILTEAIKEQQAEINELKENIENCCDLKGSVIKSTGIDNTNNNSYTGNSKLYQNVPNPFNVNTSIKYNIAEKTNNAQLLVFNMQGTLIKTYANLNSGNGEITINSGELKPGMYMYSLIVDNKEIDTKRMILTE